MSLKYWIDEIADIPTQDAQGNWYDAETGFTYQSYLKSQSKEKSSLSAKGLEARDKAKDLGGRALKGTKAQKEWAEKIRASKIAEMSEEQARSVVDPNILDLQTARFWIENREKSGTLIGETVQTVLNLVARYRAAKNIDEKDELARWARDLAKQLSAFNIG